MPYFPPEPVEDNITDGHTTIAPSGNAVFDGLALKPTLENVQDDLGGTVGGDGFIKTGDSHLTVNYSDATPSLTLTVIPTVCHNPTGVEFGNTNQSYDVTGNTWVSAVAGGALGGIPDDTSAGNHLSDCLTAITTSRDNLYLNVRESAGAASATNPSTTQFLFSGISHFNVINTRSFYTGLVSHNYNIQLWNYNTSAWDTYATFSGETDYVARTIEVFNPALYISAGVVKLQFIHTSTGNTGHEIHYDYIALCDGGGGSGGASIASAVAYTPTGDIAATNVQAAINELDSEKVAANVAITGATKTKITYDAKGLVTAGADATTADIADSSNKRYVTDANLTVIGNTSGTNTGDAATPAETTTTIGALINGATAKTTPVDADYVGLMDSAASNILKKLSWANIKATIKASTTLSITIALSDEITAITTGTAKVSWRAPFAMTLVAIPRASLTTASSSGNPTVDINEAGTTVLGANKLSIDANELTSVTAATATTLADTAIADDALITFDIDTAGTGAKGLKVTLYYTVP